MGWGSGGGGSPPRSVRRSRVDLEKYLLRKVFGSDGSVLANRTILQAPMAQKTKAVRFGATTVRVYVKVSYVKVLRGWPPKTLSDLS